MPESLTRRKNAANPGPASNRNGGRFHLGMLAGFKSEPRPASSRNTRPDQSNPHLSQGCSWRDLEVTSEASRFGNPPDEVLMGQSAAFFADEVLRANSIMRSKLTSSTIEPLNVFVRSRRQNFG